MHSNILMFIKFNNFGTQHLNEPRCLFHLFCCTTQHIFEPLHVYEPGFNTDKYGNYNRLVQAGWWRVELITMFITTSGRKLLVKCYLKARVIVSDCDFWDYHDSETYHILIIKFWWETDAASYILIMFDEV